MTTILTTPEIKAIDKIRGHRFNPPKKQVEKIPALYATEQTPTADKIAHLHFFSGNADWYVFELDPETGLAFGWAELLPGCGEWGYFNLIELAELHVNGRVIERDGWFDPTPVAELKELR